jgi:hypothetical protein
MEPSDPEPRRMRFSFDGSSYGRRRGLGLRPARTLLLINLFATIVLLKYTQTLDHFADIAAETASSNGDLGRLRSTSPLLHATLALVLLLVATTLAVYKPRGLTPYGQRKQREQRPVSR